MVGPGIIDGFFSGLIAVGAMIVVIIWIVVESLLWVFDDGKIKVEEPVTPTIELTIKEGKVDTLYIYEFK